MGDRFTTVIGISDLDVKDAGELIDDLRNTSKGVVSIQGVCADAVYGRLEMDLLLRISCTDQITVALRDIGLRNQAPGCFILFSKGKKELLKVTRRICDMHLEVDDVVLKPSNRKKELICRRLGIQLNIFLSNDVDFTSFLSERAALLTK